MWYSVKKCITTPFIDCKQVFSFLYQTSLNNVMMKKKLRNSKFLCCSHLLGYFRLLLTLYINTAEDQYLSIA